MEFVRLDTSCEKRTMMAFKSNGSTAVTDTEKVTSIRARILRRVLPVTLVPLLLLGSLAVASIFLIQQRTTDAVESAEQILTDEVVEAGVQRSSTRASRELASYLEQWFSRVDRLNDRATFRETMARVSNDLAELDLASLPEEEVAQIVTSQLTTRTNVLALTSADDIVTFERDTQVLLVSADGYAMGSNQATQTGIDYSDQEWFIRTRDIGTSIRSYVNDGEGPPAFEIALWTEPPATTAGGAVLRVRVPLTNVQALLDELANDDAVDAVLLDSSTSILIADTASQHDENVVFGSGNLMTAETNFNRALLVPGTVRDDTRVTSAAVISDKMSAERSASLTAFQWLVQTSQPIDIAASSLSGIQEVSDDVSTLQQYLTFGVGTLLAAAILFSFIAVRSVANQITAPVKQLSDQAQAAAEDGIPAVVQAARTSEELPDLNPFEVHTNDELAILAHSLNTMQDAAVDLAAGQAKLRRQNVARTFVSLGRRNQNLLNRQLEFIDELERQESDADALENLFRLDHLATRMRRNAENLLVLAGEQTPRRWAKPIAIRDVLRAAAAEIADYRRVRLGDIDPATVSGNLATDLSHLIAELLENAGSFSPPTTPVEVLGQHTATHYRLAIVDQGIGMDPAALAQVNDRLKNPVDFADAPSAYLGLFVVGRLSQELGITVRLASADPTGEGRRRGTIAFIDLPVSLLSSDAATPIEIDERTVEGVAKRVQATSTALAAGAAPVADVAPEPAVPVEAAAAPASDDTVETSGAPQVTAAGFPKRRGRGVSAEPVPLTVESHAAPEPVTPVDAPATPPTPVAPPTEITAAGFPKRRSSTTPAPETPAASPEAPDESGATPKRDATEVSNSLRSFRAAVARGRASAPTAQTPAPVPEAEPTSALSPPPVPHNEATAPAPDSAVPSQPSAEQIDHQPNPSGSQS